MSNANQNGPRGDEKFFLILVVALAIVVGLGSWIAVAALAAKEKVGFPPDHPRQLENFSLTDASGKNVSLADVKGNILVVSFLFTSCSLTCPEVTRTMAEIQRRTANREDVRILSLTVDPRSDTPPVLAKWAARFGADTNRWFMLTGEKRELHRLIAQSFLPVETNNPFNSMPGNFGGTDRIAIVDKRGSVRVFLDGLRVETPAAAVKAIESLSREN